MAALPFLLKPHNLGTIATGNERTEKPAVHLNELDAIGMVWRTNGNSNIWARGSMGVGRPIDFVSVIRANAQAGTTIRVRIGHTQAEVDGSSAPYDSGVVTFINPAITRSDGLYNSHLELGTLITAGVWRIDIGSHTGDFEAAGLVIGQRVTPARYYSSGFEFGVQDLGAMEMTRWGIPDVQDGLIARTLKFELGWIDEADYETKFRPLDEALGRRQVVFACFDPQSTTYRQNRTYMGWMKDDPFAVGGKFKPSTFAKSYSLLSMI